jgi:anti-anti-sigma factor
MRFRAAHDERSSTPLVLCPATVVRSGYVVPRMADGWCRSLVMQIEETRVGSTLVMAVQGRIDALSAQIFHDQLLGHVDRGETSVVLDFAALDFISSAGLRVVLMAAKRLQQADGHFALCALQETVREVFRVSGFASIMDIFQDRQAALEKLG